MNENKQPIRNLIYLADRGGTGWWRHIQAVDVFNSIQRQTGILNTYTEQIIADPNYYAGMNSVTVQRWTAPGYKQVFEKLLMPIAKQTGMKLIYAIDDAMAYEDIPPYNSGRDAFKPAEVQDAIKFMLNNSDYLVTTTEHIKDYYERVYGIDKEKIIAVPNMLPYFWFGDRYDARKKEEQFKQYRAKPRIGVIGSLSHYNYKQLKDENGNIYKDDFDQIADVIRETVDDYQWVIFGLVPRQIADLVEQKKVECHGCIPIMGYPTIVNNLQLQAVVVPLQDNEFNRCKSPIKYLECCALGIPILAQRMLPYVGLVPDNQMFSTQEELKERLNKLKFMSIGAYNKIIDAQWKWLNSPHKDGDFNLVSYWMEQNLGVWNRIFRIGQKDNAKEV